MKYASEKQTDRTAFPVYKPNRTLKDGLVRGFLRVMNIAVEQAGEDNITVDNVEWELYGEKEVFAEFLKYEDVKCIVSFQVYRDGGQLAIARLHNERAVDTVTANSTLRAEHGKEHSNG